MKGGLLTKKNEGGNHPTLHFILKTKEKKTELRDRGRVEFESEREKRSVELKHGNLDLVPPH